MVGNREPKGRAEIDDPVSLRPNPPGWLCASSDRVAKLTLRAICRNRRMVLITPLAHLLFNLKRFLPGLIDFMNTFSKRSLPFIGKRYVKPRPTLEDLLARQTAAEPPARKAA